jgi:hypothetical protein
LICLFYRKWFNRFFINFILQRRPKNGVFLFTIDEDIGMEQIQPQLKDFIIDYCNRYKVHAIDPNTLSTDTSIDLDLDIVDIEIDLFLAEFAEHFSIDSSRFSWYKYGYPKGSARVRILKTMFGYKRPWVKQLAGYCYKPKFKVSTLQQALQTGKLL